MMQALLLMLIPFVWLIPGIWIVLRARSDLMVIVFFFWAGPGAWAAQAIFAYIAGRG